MSKFRIVIKNLDKNQKTFSYEKIKDLILWRKYQNIEDFDTLILKLGHNNTINVINLFNIQNFLYDEKELFLSIKKINLSLFINIESLTLEEICIYNNFKTFLNNNNFNNISISMAIVIDCKKNVYIDKLSILNDLDNQIKKNVYIKNNYNYENTFNVLKEVEHIFNGFDILGSINNLSNEIDWEINKENILLLEFLKNNQLDLLGKLAPEYVGDDNNSFKTSLEMFCKEGYIVNAENYMISPLIWGAFDDFTINEYLSINEHLLMIYPDILNYWNKVFKNKLIKSNCLKCERFSNCQNKNYYFANLEAKGCSLDLLTLNKDNL